MDSGIPLLDLAERRLGWIDRRQTILAQNIANADTPGYTPKDMQPFATLLAHAAPRMAVTDPRHLSGTPASWGLNTSLRPRERAPDGNAVSVETELTKIADTDNAHALVANLYHSYLGLFRTAIGK